MKKPDRTKIPHSRRVQAFERALLCCSVPDCYSTAPSLELHHIDGRRSEPADHDLDNLAVLCRNHHVLADRGEITAAHCQRFNEFLDDSTLAAAKQDPGILLAEVRHLLWAGEFDKAEAALRLLDKARHSLNRRLSTRQEGRAQMHYADLRMMQGHPAHAIKHAALAQQRFASTGDADGIVETRAITAAAHRMLSDFGAADVFFALASEATAGIEDEPAQNERRRLVLCNRGHVLVLAGRIDDGLRYLGDSIEISIATRTASPDGGAESLVRFANALLVRGSLSEAESYLSHARTLAQKSDRRWIGGIIGKIAADMHLATGRLEEARLELSRAWSANSSGFLFQQRELMRRIRASPEVCPEELERFLRAQHQGCSRCGGRSILRMATCSLRRRSNFLFA